MTMRKMDETMSAPYLTNAVGDAPRVFLGGAVNKTMYECAFFR